MSSLTLVAVGKDLAACSQLQVPAGSVISFVDNSAGRPLSHIANLALDLCQSDVFGLCHCDVAFGDGALEAFTVAAMSGAVCGIVGIDLKGMYHCSYNDGRDDWWAGALTAGGPGRVSTLDSMAVFFRKDLGLRFDEKTFDGFHCHVEDLCLQAAARGIDPGLHIAGGAVDIAIEAELQRDVAGADGAGGRHLRHIGDLTKMTFERRRHAGRHCLRARAGQTGRYRDGREIDLRKWCYRQ